MSALAVGSIKREGQPPRWGDQIAALSAENLERLRRDEELGSALTFSPAVDILTVIREYATALSWQDVRYEPSSLAGEVTSHLVDVLRVVGEIEAFTPTDNAAARHQNLITSCDNERSWFADKVGPVIRAGDLEASSAYAELISRRDDVTRAAEEARQALALIREAAGEKGASDLAKFFASQATTHSATARIFLVLAGALVLVVFGLGTWYFFVDPIRLEPQDSADWIEFARQLLPRLLLLGVVAYGVRFAIRNYAVNKHLQVSNEQRANILKTFPILIASGQTEVQKDRMAVILAQAAVMGIETGYLKHAEDRGLDGQLLAAIELLRRG